MDVVNLEFLEIKKELEKEEICQYFKERLERKDFVRLLLLVHNEIPNCKIIVGKDSVFFVLEENLEYLDYHLDWLIDNLQEQLFDILCAKERCQYLIDKFNDKEYKSGRQFLIQDGELVKGDKKAFEELLKQGRVG